MPRWSTALPPAKSENSQSPRRWNPINPLILDRYAQALAAAKRPNGQRLGAAYALFCVSIFSLQSQHDPVALDRGAQGYRYRPQDGSASSNRGLISPAESRRLPEPCCKPAPIHRQVTQSCGRTGASTMNLLMRLQSAVERRRGRGDDTCASSGEGRRLARQDYHEATAAWRRGSPRRGHASHGIHFTGRSCCLTCRALTGIESVPDLGCGPGTPLWHTGGAGPCANRHLG